MRRHLAWRLPAATVGMMVGGLVVAPAASAATGTASVPAAFLGLPSLHSIIEGIAKGFFGALAGALVPGWLKHGTVATIQGLVALPDPASWRHVGQLQDDMVYLAVMLLPVTLAVSTVRYWLVGFTGAAHPVGAVGRCIWVTFVLVAYRWFVEQAVAATNTLTHAILGFPTVANGLQRIIGVLFGGALLTGAGGVLGAFLVIVGVLFAAGLFALQVLLTVVLALLIVAGPPLIALSAIPELSHLARTWAQALMAVTLVPLGWTVLFATAGALCLDATSFTGGAGGVPGHVAAAFAGLITFVIAVKLPLMLLGEIRHLFGVGSVSGRGPTTSSGQSVLPGAERVRAAHARLRNVAFEGVPSLGRSTGRAAGALGTPAGGPLGAARRGLAGAARRGGILPNGAASAAASAVGGTVGGRRGASGARSGVRERLANAGAVLVRAPRDARAAMAAGSRRARQAPPRAGFARPAAGAPRSASSSTGRTPGGVVAVPGRGGRAGTGGSGQRRAARRPPGAPVPTAVSRAPAKPRGNASATAQAGASAVAPKPSGAHPGRKVSASAQREASSAPGASGATSKGTAPSSRSRKPRSKPSPAPPPRPQRPERPAPKRGPRPRSGP